MENSQLPAAPRWQGVNHLALVTPDMDTTVRFYTGVLGMPLVMTLMAGPMRHYSFEIPRAETSPRVPDPPASTRCRWTISR
jgi:catechol 2,3-dioxygenase-like lactoylglutathione lyase family enzyme